MAITSNIIPTSGFVLYDPGDDDEVIIPVDGFVFQEAVAAAGGPTPGSLGLTGVGI